MKTLVASMLIAGSMTAYAGSPAWTFTPLTPTNITIKRNEYKVVNYLVTNQTNSVKVLSMQPIQGVSQDLAPGNCGNTFSLNAKQSCVLSLNINGSQLAGNITNAPIVCNGGMMCYRPSEANLLTVTLVN